MINLFWDFDGTLARHDGMWTGTLHSTLANAGFSVPVAELRPYLSLGFPWNSPDTPHTDFFGGRSWWDRMNEHFREIFYRVGVPGEEAGRLAEQVRTEYLRPDRWSLFPDAMPSLEASQRRGHASFILSNHVPELPDLARGLGLEPFLSGIVCSALVGAEKPNREIFESAGRLASSEGPCVMIGDNYVADVAGALRSGWLAVLVRGSNPKNFPYFSPDLTGAVALAEALAVSRGEPSRGQGSIPVTGTSCFRW